MDHLIISFPPRRSGLYQSNIAFVARLPERNLYIIMTTCEGRRLKKSSHKQEHTP